MHYKLLGFSQNGSLRTFWFHRMGPLGAIPIPFTVLADTSVARQYNVPLQELPSLCSRLLNATSDDRPSGALTVGDADLSIYAAEMEAARADTEAARKRRSLHNASIRARSDRAICAEH